MAVVHRAVRGTRLRDWRLQPLPGNEGTLLAVQAGWVKILGWRGSRGFHRIHGTMVYLPIHEWLMFF